MDYRQLKQSVGTEPTLLFGCSPPDETIGPIKPKSIQYGVQHTPVGYRLGTKMEAALFLNFNTYRTDLPPWEKVREIVLANETDGQKYCATLTDIGDCSMATTGDLKTVSVVAGTIVGGLEQLSIIDRSNVGRGFQGDTYE